MYKSLDKTSTASSTATVENKKPMPESSATATPALQKSYFGLDGLLTAPTNLPPVAGQNRTGMPTFVKEKYESKFGMSLADIRVEHYSKKPQEMGAIACARGNRIYLSDGGNEHLEHELGHIIQQKRGTVAPTDFINGNPVNRSFSLETEASALGNRRTLDAIPDGTSRESNTYQLFSGAVENSPTGDTHFDGSRYKIAQYKTMGWNILKKVTEGISADLPQDITIGDFLDYSTTNPRTEGLALEELTILKQAVNENGALLQEPLCKWGEHVQIAQEDGISVGADGYKNDVLNFLGRNIHDIIIGEGLECGPHVALSFIAKKLYIAINTPNAAQSSSNSMIKPEALLKFAVNIIREVPVAEPGTSESLVRELSNRYLLQIKNAVEQGAISVISSDELPSHGDEHLGTVHGEMLIAEFLRSAQNPAGTQIATTALTPKIAAFLEVGKLDEAKFATAMEPIKTKLALDERQKKHPGAMRVIRFGGTLCDCKLCHAKFHGLAGQLKSGRGSRMHEKGERVDLIGTDTYDNAFSKFDNIILSSKKSGNWQAGWQNGTQTMEHPNHTPEQNRERYLKRHKLMQEALERQVCVLQASQDVFPPNAPVRGVLQERINALAILAIDEKLLQELEQKVDASDANGIATCLHRILPLLGTAEEFHLVVPAIQCFFNNVTNISVIIQLTSDLLYASVNLDDCSQFIECLKRVFDKTELNNTSLPLFLDLATFILETPELLQYCCEVIEAIFTAINAHLGGTFEANNFEQCVEWISSYGYILGLLSDEKIPTDEDFLKEGLGNWSRLLEYITVKLADVDTDERSDVNITYVSVCIDEIMFVYNNYKSLLSAVEGDIILEIENTLKVLLAKVHEISHEALKRNDNETTLDALDVFVSPMLSMMYLENENNISAVVEIYTAAIDSISNSRDIQQVMRIIAIAVNSKNCNAAIEVAIASAISGSLTALAEVVNNYLVESLIGRDIGLLFTAIDFYLNIYHLATLLPDQTIDLTKINEVVGVAVYKVFEEAVTIERVNQLLSFMTKKSTELVFNIHRGQIIQWLSGVIKSFSDDEDLSERIEFIRLCLLHIMRGFLGDAFHETIKPFIVHTVQILYQQPEENENKSRLTSILVSLNELKKSGKLDEWVGSDLITQLNETIRINISDIPEKHEEQE